MKLKIEKQTKGITLIALVITIIVLLILAGVSIAMLIGPNGLITKAQEAKTKTEEAGAQEKIQIAIASSYGENGFDVEKFKTEIENFGGEITLEGNPLVAQMGDYEVALDEETGEIESTQDTTKASQLKAPEEFQTTTLSDPEWYNYGGTGETKVKVNTPKLKGGMTPIKFTGEIADTEPTVNSKWANAITTDGSMWVWIPRYAYKITEGYHTNAPDGGTIEIAFIDTNNNFLNEKDKGDITEDPDQVTYEEGTGVQQQWLVHPAFTTDVDNGGGLGNLTGIWVGKFEATGSTETLTVKPGVESLVNMTINEQFQLAKSSTFGESLTAEQLGSHMAKNSEWGAVAYLGHSKYGTNKQKVEQNVDTGFHTGGSSDIATIYEDNKNQSTTYNATGVYDMNGGAWDRVAPKNNTESLSYFINERMKGDAIWETWNGTDSNDGAWFQAVSHLDTDGAIVLVRGGSNVWNYSMFAFHRNSGPAASDTGFRAVLAY